MLQFGDNFQMCCAIQNQVSWDKAKMAVAVAVVVVIIMMRRR